MEFTKAHIKLHPFLACVTVRYYQIQLFITNFLVLNLKSVDNSKPKCLSYPRNFIISLEIAGILIKIP